MHDVTPPRINHETRSESGFTLIEMAIVLVIIGLIVGGVLVGQELIEQAQIRKVVTDVQSFQTAAFTFRDKYGSIPGDFPNATTMFPAPAGASTISPGGGWGPNYDCRVVAISNQLGNGWSGLCNGNGNEQIDSTNGEDMQFWYHFQAAGLISGSYSGLWDAPLGGSWDTQAPVYNVPPSPIGIGGYSTAYLGFQNYYWQPGSYGNVLQLGGACAPNATITEIGCALLTTKQAQQIDQKVDDGLPYAGHVQAPSWFSTGAGCTTNNTTTASYDRSYSGPQCILARMNMW